MRINAITIGKHILFADEPEKVKPSTIVHEYIHLTQIKEDGVIKFYFSYISSFLWRLLKTRSLKSAMKETPYELEAYEGENTLVWRTKAEMNGFFIHHH